MIKKCESCGNDFLPKQSNHKTCSKNCSILLKRKKSCEWDKLHSKGIKNTKKKCETCGNDFIVMSYNAKFCSDNCKHEDRKIRVKHRYKEDLDFKIKHNIRSRIYKAIKFDREVSSITALGCSIDELKKHLESLFKPGMTWDNYGKWHIDHIKPLSSYNLTDLNEFKIACHHTNLQPLWAKDNIRKSSKI